MQAVPPDWIDRYGLVVNGYYVTNDSDLVLQYLGHAQVRDEHGFRYVMVFRDLGAPLPLLTLSEPDAAGSAGFTPLGEALADEIGPDED